MQHPPAYTAKITDYDRSVSTRMYSADNADALIAAALCDDDEVSPDADRSGRITITRMITGHRSALDPTRVTLWRTIRLEPVCPPRWLTTRQYKDLRLIQEREAAPGTILVNGCVRAGVVSVPAAATKRLLERGWLTVGPDGTASVSYAGRVAMTLHEHRTETGYMGTDKWVVDGFGIGEWHIGEPLYLARCSCGYRAEGRFEVRAMAQQASRKHRLERLRAVFDLTA
ncbi:hypothetical protein [Streptomyces rubradiris]|uniref:Uncharacterized protein n=1 Tax=Streptomyces rubradiris TaxID=285531 RepID=A0ABQ3RAE7_STRRR|nr:hypothetical protein [Streptomyces rubradiris]GHH31431.1 hypothetical protein GCM10018792_79160 [Streptomyces rubradiris]GHI52834.1 hypothetical protein Srubr_26800 [Streptomyces rubradiris]